jgi:N6-adenosine-specific RNA methylase IME4
MKYKKLEDITKEYSLILAAPPYMYTIVREPSIKKLSDYKPLELDVIKEHFIEMGKHCTDDHVLFVWSDQAHLLDVTHMLLDLGYKIHDYLIWEKGQGMAPAFSVRFSHDYLIYSWKGKFPRVNKYVKGKYLDSVFSRPVDRHKKPAEFYEMLEDMYPNVNRIELYAYHYRVGWDCWGDKVVVPKRKEPSLY